MITSKKIGILKKLLIFILIVTLLPGTLTSCASPYSEEEAREILAEVLEKDTELNRIIWGEGFETEGDPGDHVNDSTYYYMEVSMLSKYTSLDELKEAVNETYSESLREIVYAYAFGAEGEEESNVIARYDESASGFLQIDVTNPGFNLSNIAYIGESKIIRANKKMIEIEINVSSDAKTFKEKRLTLRLENDIWKMDTQSWCIDFVD